MDAEDQMVKGLNSKNEAKISLPIIFSILFIVVAVGVSLGYVLSSNSSLGAGKVKSVGKNEKGAAGVLDKKQFPDDAEGTLKEGGIDGEGNFHLVRPGGDSQNVYLTSSIVDLSKFVGKKVRVWGQTFDSEKAGWLMDVGYVEVL